MDSVTALFISKNDVNDPLETCAKVTSVEEEVAKQYKVPCVFNLRAVIVTDTIAEVFCTEVANVLTICGSCSVVVGALVGETVGRADVGGGDGGSVINVGRGDGIGVGLVGKRLGRAEGTLEGLLLGSGEGTSVGFEVGLKVGRPVGTGVGLRDGLLDGVEVG